MTQHDRIMIYGPKADGACIVEFGRWNCNTLAEMGSRGSR
jgi:hypothetical protein